MEPRSTRIWIDLLWRAWGAFGVSTWERQPPQTVVDPEALIVMTLVAGDIRLIHETLDWGVQARKLVSTTRLRRLGALTGTSEQVDEWLGLVGTGSGTRNEPVELSGKSRRRGALIPPVPATLALRLRSFTGPTTRSDIVRALHPVLLDEVDAIDSTTLVHEVVASRNQVIDALEELIAAGLVLRIGSERRRRYLPSLEDEFARAFWSALTFPAAARPKAALLDPLKLPLRRRDGAPNDFVPAKPALQCF